LSTYGIGAILKQLYCFGHRSAEHRSALRWLPWFMS
jgi:hypothetical protein